MNGCSSFGSVYIFISCAVGAVGVCLVLSRKRLQWSHESLARSLTTDFCAFREMWFISFHDARLRRKKRENRNTTLLLLGKDLKCDINKLKRDQGCKKAQAGDWR